MISTQAGEFFAEYNAAHTIGCSVLSYGTFANNNGALTSTGYSAQATIGWDPVLNGPPCGSAANASAFTGTISPRGMISTFGVGGISSGYYSPEYETPPSILTIAYTLQSGDVMTIATDGTLTMQEAATGCAFNGKVSILDPFHSVYRLNVTATNCTTLTSWNGISEQGIIAFFVNDADYRGNSSVFGGTSFTDSNGVSYLNLFQ
jgi:hypothetical protein